MNEGQVNQKANNIKYIKNNLWKFNSNNSNYYWRNFKRFLNYLKIFIKMLLFFNNYDIIISHHKLLIPLIPIMKKKSDILIFSLRENDKDYTKNLYKLLLKRAEILTCNSQITYSNLEQFHENVKLINNGIRIKNKFNSNIPRNIKNIGVIANISKRKNIEVVIRSLLYLPKEVNLNFAGKSDDNYKKKILRILDTNNLTSQVKFYGYLNNIDEFYNKMDIIVLPSLYEGTSNVILECFNLGQLILVSNIPENICLFPQKYHKLVGFDPYDAKKLANRIMEINSFLKKSNKRKKLKGMLKSNYINLKKSYSIDKLEREYINLVKNYK